jgi:ATP-dependent DNA ligase
MNIENHVLLYKNHGKSIGTWSGFVTETGEVVIQHRKTLDGKIVESRYQAEPKNVGRANETTAVEQAISELESRTKKQLDKGYVRTLDEAKQPVTNGLGLPKPMLATPFDKVKPEKIDWENAYIQPKLDGHRALFKDGVLYSRQGKELLIPHIYEAIHEAGLENLHLDGELYIHGRPLQEISRLVKKYRPGESEALEYHIYDQVVDAPFIERISLMNEHLAGRDTLPAVIKPVFTAQANDMQHLMSTHQSFRNRGYEGTMLRFGNDPYLDGKRARSLLKVKEFHDAEFPIVGYVEGKPYITDRGTFRVPVWICETPDGETFNVTAPGNMEEKNALWETREAHIRRLLTVKYHYLSEDGIPQLPIALRFYDPI